MKKIKFLLAITMVLALGTVSAQTGMEYNKTTKGKLRIYGKVDTLTTFDATPVIMSTIAITDNTAGILEVTVVGAASTGNAITGKLIYRYKKVSGTLTIATADTASAITADTALSGGTFAIAANGSNNAKLTVTGKAATTVRWLSTITPHYGY